MLSALLLRASARRARTAAVPGASAGRSFLSTGASGEADAPATTTTPSSPPRRRRPAARRAAGPASTDDVYDVVVLGGGMVGLAVAGELATNPLTAHLRVLVADRAPAPSTALLSTPLPSALSVPAVRVSTLSPATLGQLARLGAWGGGGPGGGRRGGLAALAAPFDGMAVWDASGHGAVHYTAADGEGGGFLGGGGLAAAVAGAAAAAARAVGLGALPPPLRRHHAPASHSHHHHHHDHDHDHHPVVAGLLGAVAENDAVVASLLTAVRAAGGRVEEAWECGGLAGLDLPPLSSAASPAPSTPLATVHLAGGTDTPPRSVRARLVVGADGAGSASRGLAGLRVVEKSYGRVAVVGTVAYAPRTPLAATRTAYQVFLRGGPLALLPLRGGHASVVWTLPPADAAALVARCRAAAAGATNPAAPLAAAVDAALRAGDPAGAGAWPGRATAPPPPRVVAPPAGGAAAAAAAAATPHPGAFPLRLRFAPAWARPRFALVGDAAHAIHPLAGQGVNLGFADAAALGSALAAAVAAGGDVGAVNPTLTGHYATPRRAAAAAWVAALDGLAAAFEPQAGLAAAVRGVGLRAVGAAGPVRAAIVRFASGV